MSLLLPKFLLLTLFFFSPQPVAGGDDGDEFSNNLFSDLGPLLQLFGERFAQQFLSESIGWVDNLIFAIAPLGIITAIVGAIRVGGPSWLKAAVGRARENKGAAEIDLMSSTSDEVCELWNGQTIVRTMGKPEILQVVYYLEDETDEASFKLCSLEELSRTDISVNRHNSGLSKSPFLSGSTRLVEDVEQRSLSQPTAINDSTPQLYSAKTTNELNTYAPNISLNNTPEKDQHELWAWTICGVLIQGSVLALATLVTYYLELKKGGKEVKRYALPFIYLGTFILALGMFLCASVVEKGSKEKSWCKNGESGSSRNLRVLWLQRRHVVSDQCFDAFALIARGPRGRILTSHPSSTARLHLLAENEALPDAIPRNSSFVATVISTISSLTGFIIQFVGLRASHWSISIAQLVATFLMTIVRAIIRRGLLKRPHAEPLVHKHEMDWLATRISWDPSSFW
ncbi:hypothetical protein EDC01DRAFT_598895, partial [Geopyxis carbonaria]